MDVVRRISLLVTAALFAAALCVGAMHDRPTIDADAASQLMRSTSYWDSTIVLARNASPRGARGDALTVGLTYLERLRLGLGSPFRLVDQALDDPRLDADPSLRTRVVWGLMGRLRRGDAYVVDSSALDGLGPWDADGHGATGAQQLALIERTVESASDPRAGELTVRLAYMISAGRATIASPAVTVATEAAALVRDRVLAQRDLTDLLTDASRDPEGRDVLSVLEDRREAGAFRVERPAAEPLDAELRTEAMNAVPSLVRALDTLQRTPPPAHLAPRATQPLLGRRFAARAGELGADLPPAAPIVVASRLRSDRAQMPTNEEMLVAAYDAAASPSDSAWRSMSRAMLSDAVAMRAFAQERPWLPGDSTITAADLSAEFELAGVSFSRDVPRAWRPYYLGALETALLDMRRVFPAVSFAGLRFQFGNQTLPDSALAMHDPRTRTIQLSIASSAGTIAHELSHDLDWQTARRMYVNGRGYSTDRAMEDRHGALAESVRGLAEARVIRGPGGGPGAPSNDRPAELFARSVDWFVSSTLAMQGRSNGFLTAVQDPMLPGPAAGAPAVVGSAGAQSLLGALAQMTYVPDSARDAFESEWSDPTVVDPTLLVRRVLDAPVSWRVVWQQLARNPNSQANAAMLGGPSMVLCATGTSPEAVARDRLLALAIDARARGAAIRRARYYPTSMRAEWARGLLVIPPWRPDVGESVIAALRTSVVYELSSAAWAQGVVPVVPAIFRSSAASCSTSTR